MLALMSMLEVLTGLNLSSDEIDIQERLLKCGILFRVHDVSKEINDILDTFEWQHNIGAWGRTLVFRNAAYNKVFVDIVHVVITKDRTSCTCPPFLSMVNVSTCCLLVLFLCHSERAVRISPFCQLPRKEDDHAEVW